MELHKEKWFKILGILLAICLVYYFIILPQQKFEYQKQQDAAKQQQQKDEEDAIEAENKKNESSRNLCTSLAYDSYLRLVKLNAISFNDYETWTWDSVSSRQYVEGQYKDDKDECYKQYPVE
ncbi:MAG TPA: hypothetical protein VHQ41_00525 [Patescibacteria group bacterium]|jgi:hypothetical protein|nr:hypothetical protein [Patescibacteria group bacterium]